jgi:ketosteroid isomerase-like protein
MERIEIERLLRALYSARFSGDIEGVCRIFAENAQFRVAGASHASPIAVKASGIVQIRSWLTIMIKSFQIVDPEIVSMIIDDTRAASQWQAKIYSKVTGTVVETGLVDVVQVHDGRILSYTELFAPAGR